MKAAHRKQAAQYGDDLHVETSFFEGIVRRDPDYVEALQHLGECYSKQGDWRGALRVDKRLARLCPSSAMIQYNMACSYSLLNMLPQSLVALKQAIDLGFDDFGWLSQDPDLTNLRSWLECDSHKRVKTASKNTIPIKGIE